MLNYVKQITLTFVKLLVAAHSVHSVAVFFEVRGAHSGRRWRGAWVPGLHVSAAEALRRDRHTADLRRGSCGPSGLTAMEEIGRN